MPGSLARPPQHEHRDKGKEKELTEDRGRGPWRRRVGAATVVAGRPPSKGCDSKGAASCSRPSDRAQHLEATSGLQAAVLPTRRWRATASTEKLGQKLQQGQPEQIKPRGRDPLGGARRRCRRLEARSTNPHGQEEAHGKAEQLRHRAAAELTGAHRNRARGSSAIRDRQRGIRVRRWPSEGESVGRPARPSWFSQAHSGWLTGGPRLSA
jgi:hypothetical protein